MNREIKFRAWDKNKAILREVGEIKFDGQYYNVRIIEPTIYAPRNWSLRYFEDVILMQFTGLHETAYDEKERNKCIYDGDLIEFINGEILAVEWNDDTCQWQYSDGSPLNSGGRYGTYKKIVGNIYQNPELLTQK